MSQRMTRQGVPDLNEVGHNGHRSHGKVCRHWFVGRVIVGTRWAVDPDYGDAYEEPIYGQRCMWCPAVREERV
ncbi:MAG TPA: hypothetical protein VLE97_09785 [Gaiellaceae bacterium]|nr:hypothetical protein [Gaiellaceae bacterium]